MTIVLDAHREFDFPWILFGRRFTMNFVLVSVRFKTKPVNLTSRQPDALESPLQFDLRIHPPGGY